MMRIDLTDEQYSLLLDIINDENERGASCNYRNKEFQPLMEAINNAEIRDWYSDIKFVTKG